MAKKLPAPENRLPELVEGAGQAFGEILSTSADQEKDAVLAAGIDLGRIEAMDFVATVATHLMVTTYESVMKSKSWKYLRNPKSGDGSPYSSLEEFCEVKLGRSYRRLRELLANKKSLGQEAFEQAEQIGLRQSDYNVIKALPAPKQEIIKEALTEGASKEEVQRALRELAAADQKEIEALQEKLEDADARVLAEEGLHKSTKGQLATANKKLKRIETEDPDATLIELTKEAQGYATEALGMIRGRVRAALEALAEHHNQHGDDAVRVNMAGMLGQLQAELKALRDQYNLPDVAEAAANPDAAAWAEIRAHLGGKTAADEGAAS